MPGSPGTRFTRLQWVPALPSLTLVTPTPSQRPRRRRRTEALRRLVREHELTAGDLIQPIFVVHGERVEREIESMPGVYHLSVDDSLDQEADRIAALGIHAVILFGLPATKDDIGAENFDDHGIVQRALRRLRERIPSLLLITDVCCCEYTSHGHCGVLRGDTVDNDATLDVLGRVAVSHARPAPTFVAPSGMMDGMVAAIRGALDDAGYEDRAILSYAAKYASGFYGPFREAAESAPAIRRPAGVSDGSGQPARGPARSGARRGRGRGHDHGQAGPGLSRRRASGARAHAPAAPRLQRERRVRHGEGRARGSAGSTSGGWCSRCSPACAAPART